MNILESNVGVENEERAEDRIHDRVERAGSEGSNGERDEAGGDDPIQPLIEYFVCCIKPSRSTHLSKVQW
jgi:hypothetical protein